MFNLFELQGAVDGILGLLFGQLSEFITRLIVWLQMFIGG